MKHFHLQKVNGNFLSIGRWKFFINFDRWIKSSLQVAYFQSIQAISLTKVTSTKSQNHLSGRNYRAGVDWTWDGINIEKFRWGAISIMEIQYLLQLQKRSTQSSSPHAGTPTTDLLECQLSNFPYETIQRHIIWLFFTVFSSGQEAYNWPTRKCVHWTLSRVSCLSRQWCFKRTFMHFLLGLYKTVRVNKF